MADEGAPNRTTTCVVMLALVGVAVLGWWFGVRPVDVGVQAIVELELAGTAAAAEAVVGDDAGAYRSAVGWDFLFIVAYGLALAGACRVATRVFVTRMGRRLASASFAGALVIVGCDLLENAFLLLGLSSLDPSRDWPFQWAAGFATTKFSLLLIVLPVALAAFVVVFKRALPKDRAGTGVKGLDEKIVLPWPVQTSKGDEWPSMSAAMDQAVVDHSNDDARQHQRDAGRVPDGRAPGEVGFCLSGGGIRSGCVALGALQELREELLDARYLVSVSGGGYISGAMQLALYPDAPEGRNEPKSVAAPSDVYEHGSVEEDHTRRHGNYIADGPRQWLVALGVLGRGLLASITIISAAVITLGLALAYFYNRIPLVELGPTEANPRGLAAYFRDLACKEFAEGQAKCLAPSYPSPRGMAGWTVLWLALAACVVWLVYVWLIDMRGKERIRSQVKKAVRALWLLAVFLGTIVFVVPAALWGVAHLTYLLAADAQAGTGVVGAGRSAALTVLLAYAGSIASIVWRQRKKIASTVEKARGKKADEHKLQTAVPHGVGQYVVVWAALAVLVAANLILLASTIITGHLWDGWFQIGIPAGLLLVNMSFDQTWMSLHPFYRRRLASAFSVRRVKRNNRTVARPYDFDEESTPLYRYGQRFPLEVEEGDATPHSPRWPQVIFACAANVSGSERTPPGRRAVSYTLSHDYIGGPDVGYAPTREVTQALSGPLAADLTVQAAVAISGAAFASAMGRQARAFQTLLAISNARLGSWLPNPAYLHELSRQDAPWWLPGMPRIRRLPYLFREIFGQLPPDNRLLLVTDGGHYDNLGLVELLRHRCRTIYCIDASGDSPPFPETLDEAIVLAWEELGVRIELDDQLDLVPGSAEPLAPEDPLKGLSQRLSAKAVVTGRIVYPEPLPGGQVEGKLVFAKALLTPDMPPELLAYAQSTPVFPRDSTGDQWFSAGQFDAYQLLGQYIGARAKEVVSR